MLQSLLASAVAAALITILPAFLLAVGMSVLFSLSFSFPQILAVWAIAVSVHLFFGQLAIMSRLGRKA